MGRQSPNPWFGVGALLLYLTVYACLSAVLFWQLVGPILSSVFTDKESNLSYEQLEQNRTVVLYEMPEPGELQPPIFLPDALPDITCVDEHLIPSIMPVHASVMLAASYEVAWETSDPTVINIEWVEGSTATIKSLKPGRAIITAHSLSDLKLKSPIEITVLSVPRCNALR